MSWVGRTGDQQVLLAPNPLSSLLAPALELSAVETSVCSVIDTFPSGDLAQAGKAQP
jgi:hypothetical protein